MATRYNLPPRRAPRILYLITHLLQVVVKIIKPDGVSGVATVVEHVGFLAHCTVLSRWLGGIRTLKTITRTPQIPVATRITHIDPIYSRVCDIHVMLCINQRYIRFEDSRVVKQMRDIEVSSVAHGFARSILIWCTLSGVGSLYQYTDGQN